MSNKNIECSTEREATSAIPRNDFPYGRLTKILCYVFWQLMIKINTGYPDIVGNN